MMTATMPVDSSTGLACPPRFATQRNYARKTLGAQAAKVAEELGTPFMPWQQYVADVALEIDPDTGLLWYREVDLTVPRQSGKTTLIIAIAVLRALGWKRPQNIVYTAQTRAKAREKWEDEHVAMLKASRKFRRLFKVRLSNGHEAIIWNNKSKHGIDADTEKSGHGGTLDLGFVDEAFSQIDTRQEQALKPAMITRRDAQLWVVSTAGTKTKSTYLWGKVEKGRARVQAADATSRVAYFEWSAPDDADPYDEATWWGCMPALGFTQTVEAVRGEADSMDLADFQRAYLNQWVEVAKTERPIPVDDWAACRDPESQIPAGTPLVLTVDVSPTAAWSSLGIAGISSTGRDHVELINHKQGTEWIVPRVREVLAEHGSRIINGEVALDPAGQAGQLVPDLIAADIPVRMITSREMAQAFGSFLAATRPRLGDDGEPDLTVPRRLVHLGQPSLDAALESATKRPLGDAEAWARKGPADISPVVALTIARALRAQYAGSSDEYDPLDSIY